MSYYFGIALKDSVIFGCDRTFNDAITGENRADSKRYSVLGDNRVFLPTGNMCFCKSIEGSLQYLFRDSLEVFEEGDSMYSKLFSSDYQKVKEDSILRLQALGKTGDTENVDCLYGGFDENGFPFIISLSSVDDFHLQLINLPMQYVCLNQSPKVLEYVKKTLRAFMGAAADQGAEKVWDLGRGFLPAIIQKVSKADPLVSWNGDLIFMSSNGIQTYEF
jgi:hypothetical protein